MILVVVYKSSECANKFSTGEWTNGCGYNYTVGGVRRRRQRQRQLWQFLLEILSDDKYSSIIHWVQRDEGVFRFVQPKSVAQLWGKRRRRQNMTYEHLSRAMRYTLQLLPAA